MTLHKNTLLAATLCLGATLHAQELQPGVQGGINIPVGDLGDALDHRPGVTIGGHMGIYYGDGHELRPRADFTYYDGGHYPEGGGYNKNKVTALGLGCDYIYYVARQPSGMFLTGGLGYQWWTVSPDHGSSASNSGLSMALGSGYRFNRSFALEGRITNGQFRSGNGQATALQALASLRF